MSKLHTLQSEKYILHCYANKQNKIVFKLAMQETSDKAKNIIKKKYFLFTFVHNCPLNMSQTQCTLLCNDPVKYYQKEYQTLFGPKLKLRNSGTLKKICTGMLIFSYNIDPCRFNTRTLPELLRLIILCIAALVLSI